MRLGPLRACGAGRDPGESGLAVRLPRLTTQSGSGPSGPLRPSPASFLVCSEQGKWKRGRWDGVQLRHHVYGKPAEGTTSQCGREERETRILVGGWEDCSGLSEQLCKNPRGWHLIDTSGEQEGSQCGWNRV